MEDEEACTGGGGVGGVTAVELPHSRRRLAGSDHSFSAMSLTSSSMGER